MIKDYAEENHLYHEELEKFKSALIVVGMIIGCAVILIIGIKYGR